LAASVTTVVEQVAKVPGVLAVTLGGSRARGLARSDSDWDFGVYYRGSIDTEAIRSLGYPGTVVEPGEWGRIVNGGAWLRVAGERVDLLYRDLDVVEHWLTEAMAGRFGVDYLPTTSPPSPPTPSSASWPSARCCTASCPARRFRRRCGNRRRSGGGGKPPSRSTTRKASPRDVGAQREGDHRPGGTGGRGRDADGRRQHPSPVAGLGRGDPAGVAPGAGRDRVHQPHSVARTTHNPAIRLDAIARQRMIVPGTGRCAGVSPIGFWFLAPGSWLLAAGVRSSLPTYSLAVSRLPPRPVALGFPNPRESVTLGASGT
jgi:predicted nucleotidyltransferase